MKSRLHYVYIAAMLCMFGTYAEAQVKRAVIQSNVKPVESLTLTDGEKLTLGNSGNAFVQSVDFSGAKAQDLSKQKLEAKNFSATNTRTVAPRAAKSVPYVETFDNTSADGNPLTLEALGWTVISGGVNKDFSVGLANSDGEPMPGHSGNYYLISGYDSNAARNEWAITPGVSLQAGIKYRIAIWGRVPGYKSAMDEFRVTVGSQATVAAQSTILIDKSGANKVSVSDWTEFSVDYTPTVAGTYYFGLHFCTSVPDVNLVSFDDFSVKDPSSIVAPVAEFSFRTLEGEGKTTYGGVVEFTDKSTNDPTNWNWYPFGVEKQSTNHTNLLYAIYTPKTQTVYDIALAVKNSAGYDSICKPAALTVDAKAYNAYPYIQRTFSAEPLQALAWGGTGWNTNQTFKIATAKGAQLFSKWFYLEAGKEYRVSSGLAAAKDVDLSFVLVALNSEDKLAIVKTLENYNWKNGDSRFNTKTKRFTVPASGNYQLGYLATNISSGGLVGLQLFSLEEVTLSSAYADIIPNLTATANGKNAELSYFVSGTPDVMAYTNGIQDNIVGVSKPSESGPGMVLSKDMLRPYAGKQIKGIQVYIDAKENLNPVEDVYGMIVGAAKDSETFHAGSLPFTSLKDGWNMVDLSDDSYLITGDEDIIVYSVLTQVGKTNVATFDSDLENVILGQTDILYSDGELMSCNAALGGTQAAPKVGHAMIRVLIGDNNTDFTALIPDGYNIYRNGTLLTALNAKSYTDANLADGTYKYAVKAVFDRDAESSPSAEATVSIGASAILDIDAEQVKVYVSDKTLKIEGAEGKAIVIYSIDGKLVSFESNAENMYNTNLSDGIYLVKINNKTVKAIIQ